MNIRRSKYLSYILRHNPSEVNSSVDCFDWLSVSDLINNSDFTMDELEDIVYEDTRYEFSSDKQYIRAFHGHSISGVVPKQGYSYDVLQSSLYEVCIWDVLLDDEILVDYPNAQTLVNAWVNQGQSTKTLRALKNNNSYFMGSRMTCAYVYKHILQFNAEDQWGKLADGTFDSSRWATGVNLGAKNVKVNTTTSSAYWSDQATRSITVYKVNMDLDTSMSVANLVEKVRYISSKYLNTLNASSYWADYGLDLLADVLSKREREAELKADHYSASYINGFGHSIKIDIEDYTGN